MHVELCIDYLAHDRLVEPPSKTIFFNFNLMGTLISVFINICDDNFV